MSPEAETMAALRRAAVRVAYHLLRAGVEGLKAVEAVIDELARVGREDEAPEGPVRVEVE